MYYGLCTAESPQKNRCQCFCAFYAFPFLPSLSFGSSLLLVLRRRPLVLLVVVIVVLVLLLRVMPLFLLLLVLGPMLRPFRPFPHPFLLVFCRCVVLSVFARVLGVLCVEGFLWMGSQGVLSTVGFLLLRDCQNASENASLPHGVCGRKK